MFGELFFHILLNAGYHKVVYIISDDAMYAGIRFAYLRMGLAFAIFLKGLPRNPRIFGNGPLGFAIFVACSDL